MEFLRKYLFADGFMPHGQCWSWTPGLVTLHVLSDSLIALAYYSIPIVLVVFVRKRADLPFQRMFLYFGLFILACGTTHLMDVWTTWHSAFWVAGYVKLFTAAASVSTAIMLWPLLPQALALPSPGLLRRTNAALQQEIAEHQRTQESLRQLNAELEQRVQERTQDLERANADLRAEVAERERAEGEVRRLNSELEQRVRDRTAELEAANSELEAFAYSVSHDLRAPLRGLNGFSQVLLEDYAAKLDEAGQNFLRRIRSASQRMGQLIDDLLQLSRVTRTEMSLSDLDLGDLAQSIIAELRAAEPERAVTVSVAPGLRVRGDERLLRVALVNLLANAWKFTARQSSARIEVGATQRDGTTVFFVRDNGAGFEMQYAGKLFAPFQRLHSEEEYPGTGIGLATVKRVIRRHGGQVWAEAAPGQGATFYFTL